MAETKVPVPLPNTYWVIPSQVLTGEYPGHFDEGVTGKKLCALVDAGVRTFVDLTDEDETQAVTKRVLSYRVLLRQLAEDRRIEVTYARIPIRDGGIPSVWTLRCILDVIDRSVADENPVFVHCWAGRGRTGVVVGCYLKRHQLATDHNVVEKIAELRRLMPCGGEPSPQTAEQVRMVRTWKIGA